VKRPASFKVGQKVLVRVHRGPRDDGRWYWRADRQQGGRREHVWHGWGTPDEAEAAVIAELGATDRVEAGHEQIRTLHDLLECWSASQDERSDVSEHTQRNATAAAGRLSGVIGTVQVDRVDRRVLERYRDRSPDSSATIARDLKYLRQAWRWGREVGAVPLVDLPSIRVQRQEPVRSRYTPTRDEVARILLEVRRHSEHAYRGVVLLAATGARPGGIVAIRWRDYTPAKRLLEVTDKTGHRTVSLHPEVAGELARWWAADRGLLVPEAALAEGRIVQVTDETIRWRLREAAEVLGIPRVTPTGFRRYVVDALYRSGQVDAAAAQLGHSPATALAIYRQVTDADRAKAVLRAGLGMPTREARVLELVAGDLPHDLPHDSEE
jgi:integrase